MPRFCVRRKRTFLAGFVVMIIFTTFISFSGKIKSDFPLSDIPSDYELQQDSIGSEGIHAQRFIHQIHPVKRAASLGDASFKHIDRKPQSHHLSETNHNHNPVKFDGRADRAPLVLQMQQISSQKEDENADKAAETHGRDRDMSTILSNYGAEDYLDPVVKKPIQPQNEGEWQGKSHIYFNKDMGGNNEDDYVNGEEDIPIENLVIEEKEEDEEPDEYDNYYDYELDPNNKPFKKGDFDYEKNETKVLKFQFEEVKPSSKTAKDVSKFETNFHSNKLLKSIKESQATVVQLKKNISDIHQKLTGNNSNSKVNSDKEVSGKTKDIQSRKHSKSKTKSYFLNGDIKEVRKVGKIVPKYAERSLQNNLGVRPSVGNNQQVDSLKTTKNYDLKFQNNPDNFKNQEGLVLENPSEVAKGLPQPEKPATQLQVPGMQRQRDNVTSQEGFPIVVQKIYWSEEVESRVPPGTSYHSVVEFKKKILNQPVKEMHHPKWNRCGREDNQYIIMADGTPLCARYRDPYHKLIHGEILSFYLARLLGLDNVPVVLLSQVNSSSLHWRGHNLTKANWKEGQITALIQWIGGLDSELSRVRMPSVILTSYQAGVTFSRHHPTLPKMTVSEITDVLQWSDMILFDYITGHYDRVASMQDGANMENKQSIMGESIRNLKKDWHNSKLWLIDNESGLLDAYENMFTGHLRGKNFIEFHQQMLKTFCIFRKTTADKIMELADYANPDEFLIKYTQSQEPLYDKIPNAPRPYKLFRTHFKMRLKEVKSWLETCKSR